jgi:hypothetical protein
MRAPSRDAPRRESITGGVLLAALSLGWIGGSNSHLYFDLNRPEMDGQAALNTVVERIIHAESDGDPNPKKKRSSATGAAQFLDGTWLEMIRVHRPDLIEGRSEKDILDLRRGPELARESRRFGGPVAKLAIAARAPVQCPRHHVNAADSTSS